MRSSWLRSSVTAIALLSVLDRVFAQPLFGDAQSIECTVINADLVVLGELVELRRDGDGVAANLAIEKTLKGEHRPRLRVLLARSAEHLVTRNDRLQRFMLAARDGSSGKTHLIDLGSEDLAVLTADLTLLRQPGDVVKIAQQAIGRMPGVLRIETFRLVVPREIVGGTSWADYYGTGGYLRLEVPVDDRLEKRARDYIQSKDYSHRAAGARALRYFNSEENVRRVKALLDDCEWAYSRHAEHNDGVEVRTYGVRKAAYDTLEYWGIEVEPPIFREEVSKPDSVQSVSLSGEEVGQSKLEGLARFKNLQNLSLSHATIKDEALKGLIVLENLETLDLSSTEVTDAGLKPLAHLTDLQYLDLGGTNITDAGLKQLAEIESLQGVYLKGSRVTRDGVSQLRKLRRELEIEY